MAMVETGEVEAVLTIVTGDDIEDLEKGAGWNFIYQTAVGVGKKDPLKKGIGRTGPDATLKIWDYITDI